MDMQSQISAGASGSVRAPNFLNGVDVIFGGLCNYTMTAAVTVIAAGSIVCLL